MEFRALVIALLAMLFSSNSQAVYFAGEISTTDSIGIENTGYDFYYDLYHVTVDIPLTIEVFMTPTQAFAPYLAYWDGDFTPAPDWNTPAPEKDTWSYAVDPTLYLSFDALPGIDYQIMASTADYNPTVLGTYDFFIVDVMRTNQGFTASSVPEPASWILVGLGLVGIRLSKRK